MQKGGELWKIEHKTDARSPPKKPREAAAPAKTETPKLAGICEDHSVGDTRLSRELEDGINQTNSKTPFQLLPQDLIWFLTSQSLTQSTAIPRSCSTELVCRLSRTERLLRLRVSRRLPMLNSLVRERSCSNRW
ncbi:hypothetical protein SVAN01_04128 [Stagonosporopsis vannaccii]|nr:hypothetical protein SVAN01_04128 [Stagonosporopsis vannaccii]